MENESKIYRWLDAYEQGYDERFRRMVERYVMSWPVKAAAIIGAVVMGSELTARILNVW